jgi:hypothetical protein
MRPPATAASHSTYPTRSVQPGHVEVNHPAKATKRRIYNYGMPPALSKVTPKPSGPCPDCGVSPPASVAPSGKGQRTGSSAPGGSVEPRNLQIEIQKRPPRATSVTPATNIPSRTIPLETASSSPSRAPCQRSSIAQDAITIVDSGTTIHTTGEAACQGGVTPTEPELPEDTSGEPKEKPHPPKPRRKWQPNRLSCSMCPGSFDCSLANSV